MSERKNCQDCGGYCKSEFEMCWDCFQAKMAKEGRMCTCGKLKQPHFEECRECGFKKRNRTPYEKQAFNE